jgi:hypothetical protein
VSDQIQFTADGSQAFDVIDRLKAELASLKVNADNAGSNGAGADRIGEGFLRSERVVARSAANMVGNILSANNAAEALANTFLQVEHATVLGLGAAVGLAVGVAAVEKLHQQFEAIEKAYTAAVKATSTPIEIVADLSPADIATKIDAATKADNELRAANKSTVGRAGIAAVNPFAEAAIGAFAPGLEPIRRLFGHEHDKVVDQLDIRDEQYLHDLVEKRANAELRVADLKAKQLSDTSEEVELAKADLEYTQAKAKLFDGAFKPGADQLALFKQLAALSETHNAVSTLAAAKLGISESAFNHSEAVATFQGTPEAKAQFASDDEIRRLSILKGSLKALGDENDAKKIGLDLDKAISAEADRQLTLSRQRIDLESTQRQTALKVQTAQAGIDLGPEASQRLGLQSQIESAKDAEISARERLKLDKDDISAQQALVKAIGDQASARATLEKFDKEKAFKYDQELSAAQAATSALQLQSTGHSYLAKLLETREQTERKILQILHDQRGEIGGQALAEQTALQGKQKIIDQLANNLWKPAQSPEEAAQALRERIAEQQVNQAAADEVRGAKLDESSPVTQALRQIQRIDQELKSGEQSNLPTDALFASDDVARRAIEAEGANNAQGLSPEKGGLESLAGQDFSSLASLGGADFSSLASLSNVDFSGVAALGGLQISIA